jgi:hypothetical protein
MKTKKMSRGVETSYKTKLEPKKMDIILYMYLYDDHRNIARAYDMLYVAKG